MFHNRLEIQATCCVSYNQTTPNENVKTKETEGENYMICQCFRQAGTCVSLKSVTATVSSSGKNGAENATKKTNKQ